MEASVSRKWKTIDMAYIALFAVLMAVCSWISIPAVVPFTLQTFGVFVAVSVLGGKRGTLAVVLYLLMGIVGLPVFAGFSGGLGVLLGSTGGYIIGFVFTALVMWLIERLLGTKTWVLALSMLLGLAVCYAFGTAWFLVVYTKNTGAIGLWTALGKCVFPYILPDCLKIALALAIRKRLAAAIRLGRRIHYLPPYRGETKLQLSVLLGIAPALLHDYKSVDLMFAVAEMREVKSAEEVAQMEDAFHIGYAMHTTAMRMCRAGVVEREIAGAIEGVAKSMGLGVSFPSIVSQHGETLHNLNSEGVLADGRLLLVDAGGENRMNYCSDHTRTYPVSGRFTAQQREIYDIVLACHDHIARIVRPGMMYMQEVHLEAYRKLAEGLVGVGLLKGSADDAVAAGAMYLFMPHGLGHGLGMDVHDCENIGERSFDYSLVAERAAQSATCLHRATWRLRPGTILSDEPGIYFIPALVDKCEAEGKFRGIVDYDLLRSRYLDFGGIRIEDDLLVTDTGCRILGDRTIPVTVEELEAVVGR